MRKLLRTILLLLSAVCVLSAPVRAEEGGETENEPVPVRTWVVAKDGRGDFETIQSAIDAASDYDVIRITPGTYEEHLKAAGKTLNLIGDDPYSCIVRCPGWDYANPALEMSSGTLKNLTLRTYADGTVSEDGTFGYCLHTDYDHQTGRDLYCENCHFISECGACAGIGLRPHFTLEFNNCTFDSRNAQGAIFCHDYELEGITEETDLAGQRLIIRDCALKDGSPAVIRLQSQELRAGCAELTFQRNIVTATAENGAAVMMFFFEGRNAGGGNYLGSSDFILGEESALNTDEQMNREPYV